MTRSRVLNHFGGDPLKPPAPPVRDASKVRVPGPNAQADSLEALAAKHPASRGAEGNVYDLFADERQKAADLRKSDAPARGPIDEFELRFGGDRAQNPARGVADAADEMNRPQRDVKSKGMAILAKLLLSK